MLVKNIPKIGQCLMQLTKTCNGLYFCTSILWCKLCFVRPTPMSVCPVQRTCLKPGISNPGLVSTWYTPENCRWSFVDLPDW